MRDALGIDVMRWQNGRVRRCSLGARGLLLELLLLAELGEPFGHVAVDGHALTESQIASFVAAPLADVQMLMAELDEAGVLKRDSRARIYSPSLLRTRRRGAR